MHYNSIKYVGAFRDLKNLGYKYSAWSTMNWAKTVGNREDNFRIYKSGGWMSISEFTNFEGYLLLYLINLRATNGRITKIKSYRDEDVYYASIFIDRRNGRVSSNPVHRDRQFQALQEAKKCNPDGDHSVLFHWMDYFIRWEVLEELIDMYDKGLIIPVIDKETYKY